MAQILALVRGVYRNIDGADLVRCEPNQNRLDARVEKRTDPVTLLDPESEQTLGETGRRRTDIGIAILHTAELEEQALWDLCNRGGTTPGQDRKRRLSGKGVALRGRPEVNRQN